MKTDKNNVFNYHFKTGDIDYDETMRKNWLDYQKWIAKQQKKGLKLDDRAMMYAEGIDEFAQRFEDLVFENTHTSGRHFDSIMSEMKQRSFVGGSDKQLVAYASSLEQGLKDLKAKDKDEYEKIMRTYPDLKDILKHKSQLGKDERTGGIKFGDRTINYMNKNRWNEDVEQMGYFDLVSSALNRAGEKFGLYFIFNSPA